MSNPVLHVDPQPLSQTSETKEPVAHATVYTFVVWDHDVGATVIYPKMGTREIIAKMRGKVNEDTAWVVDASALDIEGFYTGDPR
jgi:hypothetical protein